MKLTDNKYQDLTNLINLYNQSGKIVLTGNKDVDYEILYTLNLEDLSKVCSLNKYSRDLCSNPVFWLTKHKNENLPIIKSDYYSDYPLDMWYKFYKRTKISKNYAINALKIHQIQYDNIEDKPYIIIYNRSPEGYLENLMENFNIYTEDIKSIYFLPNDTTISIDHTNSDEHEVINFSKQNITDLLTFVYLYNFVILRFPVLCDSDPLLKTENITMEVPEERIGILKAIHYYKMIDNI